MKLTYEFIESLGWNKRPSDFKEIEYFGWTKGNWDAFPTLVRIKKDENKLIGIIFNKHYSEFNQTQTIETFLNTEQDFLDIQRLLGIEKNKA